MVNKSTKPTFSMQRPLTLRFVAVQPPINDISLFVVNIKSCNPQEVLLATL